MRAFIIAFVVLFCLLQCGEAAERCYFLECEQAPPLLGLDLATLTPDLRVRYGIRDRVVKGVVISRVDPNGAAAGKKLAAGMVILEVGWRSVADPDEVEKEVDGQKKAGHKNVVLHISTADGDMWVALPID